jgi:hypothetical protein
MAIHRQGQKPGRREKGDWQAGQDLVMPAPAFAASLLACVSARQGQHRRSNSQEFGDKPAVSVSLTHFSTCQLGQFFQSGPCRWGLVTF